MNLVIDDAVEVRQITKTNETESRRSLGRSECDTSVESEANICRPNLAQRRQCLADPERIQLNVPRGE